MSSTSATNSSSTDEIENLLSSFISSSFNSRELDEDNTMPLSVGISKKRPRKSSEKKIKRFTAPQLDEELRIELRNVPGLKTGFSNAAIEEHLGFREPRRIPVVEDSDIFSPPIYDRECRSLYPKVNEDDFVKVDETNYKRPNETVTVTASFIDKNETVNDKSQDSLEKRCETATTAVYHQGLRIRNAAILSLLEKAKKSDVQEIESC